MIYIEITHPMPGYTVCHLTRDFRSYAQFMLFRGRLDSSRLEQDGCCVFQAGGELASDGIRRAIEAIKSPLPHWDLPLEGAVSKDDARNSWPHALSELGGQLNH